MSATKMGKCLGRKTYEEQLKFTGLFSQRRGGEISQWPKAPHERGSGTALVSSF